MRTAFNIIGSLVLVSIIAVGGAVMALPYFLSTDLVKNKVALLVEEKTGRKLTIRGDTSFKLFPNIAVSLDDISLSNPSGMKGAPLVKMASLRTNLKLMPLFSGRAEVDSLTLINPAFNLQVNKKGLNNWDFQSNKSDDKTNDDRQPGSSALKNFTLGAVTIKNGTIHYSDARSGFDDKVEAINIVVVQKTSDQSISTKGNVRWHNEIMTITSMVAKPNELIAGKSSKIALNIKSRFTNTDYQGSLNPENQSIDGFLVLDTPSVRKLATFLGHDLPPGKGFGKLKLKTKIKANENRLEYTTDQFLFDNMELSANGSVDLKKTRPYIIANIEADRLDLNPYLGDETAPASTRSLGSGGKATDTPVDLSGLKAIDGQFSIKTTSILYKKARLGNGDFKVGVKNGRANVDIKTLSLYRGTASGKFVLDGRGSTNVIGGNLAIKDVLTGALLRDFTGFDKLAGKGTLNGDFNTRGNSLKALKGSLKGTMKIALLKGRFEGFDLAKYVSEKTGNKLPGVGGGGNGKPMTAYDKMSGLLKINKGVARNKNFLLTGKFFRVRAAGTIDLVRESLRLRIAPKLFSGDWSFAPPLRVIGNWLKPKVKFDALAFLGGGQGILRSLGGLASGKVELGNVLQNRGLQTDAEIESYLAGKKIDARTPAANDNQAETNQSGNDGNSGNASNSSSPIGKLLGGDKKATDKLLKKLFQ